VSGPFVTLVLDAVIGIEPSAKLVLVALADNANSKHNGVAFPSVATLARRAGICERQVRSNLRKLEAQGWITRESAGDGGRGMATRYRLNLDRMKAAIEQQNPEAHRRLSTKEGGSALPGISEETRKPGAQNPEVQRRKPGSGAYKTRKPAAPELEVTGITGKNFAREREPALDAPLAPAALNDDNQAVNADVVDIAESRRRIAALGKQLKASPTSHRLPDDPAWEAGRE
jgi:DNA-binding Lrp family transcriptional regulator